MGTGKSGLGSRRRSTPAVEMPRTAEEERAFAEQATRDREREREVSPLEEGRNNIELRIRKTNGEIENIRVSIQSTTRLDQMEDVASMRGEGRYREGNIYRNLAGDAENNVRSRSNDPVINTERHAEIAKEGKFTKIDDVPVVRKIAGAMVLEKTTGYVTKIDGEVWYIQKSQGGGFAPNYAGISARPPKAKGSSLAAAKTQLQETAGLLRGNAGGKEQAAAGMADLNYNLGRISQKVWDEMQKNRNYWR